MRKVANRGFALVFFGVLSLGFALQGCGHNAQSNDGDDPSELKQSEGVSKMSAVSAVKNVGAKTSEGGVFNAFSVYTDAEAPGDHFFASGWMGDFGDIKINEKYSKKPHSGGTCIQIDYSNKASQGARWAGVYWQNPPNNWGTRPGGFDLTGAKKVTFWARGEKGGERIEEFKIGGITGEYADSDVAGIGPVVLTAEWQQFTIDLQGKDLSSISGGFCWSTNLEVNPDGITFYLDDIRYDKSNQQGGSKP